MSTHDKKAIKKKELSMRWLSDLKARRDEGATIVHNPADREKVMWLLLKNELGETVRLLTDRGCQQGCPFVIRKNRWGL